MRQKVLEKVANNVFTTRSRSRTSVVRLVRERYVRAIPCGFAQCTRCTERQLFVCSLQNVGHVVVPGVTSLLYFFDLIEQFENVVVLQSVLASVRSNSPKPPHAHDSRENTHALVCTLARSYVCRSKKRRLSFTTKLLNACARSRRCTSSSTTFRETLLSNALRAKLKWNTRFAVAFYIRF